MNYVTKLGASALAVAAAFAVAFAVLMSSASPVAAISSSAATAAPGDTVTINEDGIGADEWVTFAIGGLSKATASFVSGGGQSLLCQDRATTTTCDVDGDAGELGVKVKIDADSPDGPLVITSTAVDGSPETQTIVVNVSSDGTATSISAKSNTDSISIGATSDANFATIKGRVKNAKGNGVDGKSVSIITTNGAILTDSATEPTTTGCTSQGACSVTTAILDDNDDTTNDAGQFTVKLIGTNRPGDAVITFTSGDLSATVTVTLFGSAKNVAVDAEQGSIEQGGSTFLVVNVTDAAGSPVKGHQAITATVKGPSSAATGVTAATNAPKEVGTADGDVADKGELPHCDNTTPATPTDVTEPANYAAGGTNDKGQCVVKVSATAKATRGAFEIKVTAGTNITDTATVTVAGKPASVSTDAPDSVEPLSQTKITVTVQDDEGVNAGVTSVKVTKVDGGGIIEDAGTNNTEDTKDGVSSFTYFAGASDGDVTIVIDAGSGADKVREVVTISVASPAPPEPDMATLSGTGALRIFSGGSVSDLAAAAMAACPGGAQVWAQDSGGNWVVYSTTAPAFVNASFSAAFADGLGEQAVFVAGCDAGNGASMAVSGPSMNGDDN